MSDKASNTSSSWVSRPVFISSTFKDMQAERDHLNKVVFPELAERLKARRVLLEPIDLRQGVETKDEKDEQTRELLTLKVCLDEIDKSRPLLIVLLGDRYGWTPAHERLKAAANEKGFEFDVNGKSVTALEIEYGLLKKDKWLRTNSLFLFRNPLPYDKMPQAKREEYSEKYSKEANATDKADSLEALKKRIKGDPELNKQVRTYSLDWDIDKNEVTGLEAWGNQVKEDIWQILDAETKDIEQKLPKTWDEEEQLAIEEFVEDRCRNFVGREDIITKLLAFAHSEAKDGADWGACVTAGPGTGKSALFAKLYRELEHDEAVLLLSHAAGTTPKSGDVDSMLLRWITELSIFLNISNPLPEKYSLEDLDNTFASLLSRSSVKTRVVVLIDALNQFNLNTRGLHMTWLKRPWPSNARIIATAIEGEASEGLAQWAGVEEYELGGLSNKNAEDIITAIYTRYHRQVNQKVKGVLLNKTGVGDKKAYTNPLWLNLALEQLNLLDEDDFALSLGSDTDPAELIANEMPGDIPGLYVWILKRMEKTYGTAWVVSIVALVALSRQGWREMDFAAMLPEVAGFLFPDQEAIAWDSLKFAVIRRGLRGQLIQSGSHGRWRFMHQQMKEAALSRIEKYLKNKPNDELINLHSPISTYLLSLTSEDPVHISETMWHLLREHNTIKTISYYASDLSTNELISASDALAEWFIDENVGTNNEKLLWLAEWLIENEHYTEQSYIIGICFMKLLLPRIESNSTLHIRMDLIEIVRYCFSALVSNNPELIDIKVNLCEVLMELGGVYQKLGNLSEAHMMYKGGTAVIEGLVEADPNNLLWQEKLSGCLDMLGGIKMIQGDIGEAKEIFLKAIGIEEELLSMNPDNIDIKFSLTASYDRLAHIYRAEGNLVRELELLKVVIKIREQMVTSEIGSSRWHEILIVTYLNASSVYEAQEYLDDSLETCQKGIKLSLELTSRDPKNTRWQELLYGCYHRQGNIQRLKGDTSKAYQSLQSGLDIIQKLVSSDPSNKEWQRQLASFYEYICFLHESQGDLSSAITSLQSGLEINKVLCDDEISNAELLWAYSRKKANLGSLYAKQRDYDSSISSYLVSLDILTKLINIDAQNLIWKRDIALTNIQLSSIYKNMRKLDNAENAALKAIDAYKEIIAGNITWKRELAVCFNQLGDIYMCKDNYAQAMIAFEAGLNI